VKKIHMEFGHHVFLTIPLQKCGHADLFTIPEVDHFDSGKLNSCYRTLRVPLPEELCKCNREKRILRSRGVESISSLYTQTLIARKQQVFHYSAETCLEFEPESFLQSAGLIALYDTQSYYYLKVTHHEKLGKCVSIAANIAENTYIKLQALLLVYALKIWQEQKSMQTLIILHIKRFFKKGVF